jgi:hypothetical protein
MSGKARYDRLKTGREQFLQRARHNALLTIPSLMPLEGQDDRSHLIEPYQGLGARVVMHLASRNTTAFMPAGRNYMKFELPPLLAMQNGGEVDSDVERGLALMENLVQSKVEITGWRAITFQANQQLLVAGTVCEHTLDDDSIRLFRLDSFVVRRDNKGKVAEFVIEEKFDKDTLPVEWDKFAPEGAVAETEVRMYTWGRLDTDKRGTKFFKVTQHIDDAEVGAENFLPEDLPYRFLRWSATPGEDYGRAKVEEHVADFRSLEALDKALLELSALATRGYIFIRPGANTAGIRMRINAALTGDAIVADPEHIEFKSFDVNQAISIVEKQAQTLRENIAKAFLLFSAGQRNAERVTATEIERDLQELEAALGGNFASLIGDMMGDRTRLLVKHMKARGELPDLPDIGDEAVKPVILTGLDALSRERDASRAMQAASLLNQFGEKAISSVKLTEIIKPAMIGLGFPEATRTEAERVAEEERQSQLAAAQGAVEKGAPNAVKAVAEGGGV